MISPIAQGSDTPLPWRFVFGPDGSLGAACRSNRTAYVEQGIKKPLAVRAPCRLAHPAGDAHAIAGGQQHLVLELCWKKDVQQLEDAG